MKGYLKCRICGVIITDIDEVAFCSLKEQNILPLLCNNCLEKEKSYIRDVLELLDKFKNEVEVHIFGFPRKANETWKLLIGKLELLTK